jgi:hypothetical protein
MITKQMQGYPYNRINSDNPLQLRLSEFLLDILPHGSGINGSWVIDNPKTINNRFYCHNTFESMNENGMYCHNYDFTLTIDYIPESDRKQTCQYCNKLGFRYIKDLSDIRHSTIQETIDFLNRTHYPYPINDKLESPTFICNNCKGDGYTRRHPFELIRLNWHGQKEYTCCASGLKDYIHETVDYCLSELKGDSE